MHYFFRFFLVQRGQFIPRAAFRSQQFIKFGVNCLRVARLGALNEQGHYPSRDRSDACPLERPSVENQPKRDVNAHDDERDRVGRRNAYFREPTA